MQNSVLIGLSLLIFNKRNPCGNLAYFNDFKEVILVVVLLTERLIVQFCMEIRYNNNHFKTDKMKETFDTNSDSTINPLLWETRRKRIIELMGEGFGFHGICR